MKMKKFLSSCTIYGKLKARYLSDPISVITKSIHKHEKLVSKGIYKFEIMKDLFPSFHNESESESEWKHDSVWMPYQMVK